MSGRCDNCGVECYLLKLVHWDSIGEVELYCPDCYIAEQSLPMTDEEINSILQL